MLPLTVSPGARSVKAENVLLAAPVEPGQDVLPGTALLGDLGLVGPIRPGGLATHTGGTRGFTPPEVHQDCASASAKADGELRAAPVSMLAAYPSACADPGLPPAVYAMGGLFAELVFGCSNPGEVCLPSPGAAAGRARLAVHLSWRRDAAAQSAASGPESSRLCRISAPPWRRLPPENTWRAA